MKRYALMLAVVLNLGFLQAHTQTVIKDPNVQVRNTGPFNAIAVSSAIDLVVTQDKNVAVAVSASEAKYVESMTTEVRNNTLYIGYKGSSAGWGPKYMRAYVSAPMLYKLTASGACNIKTDGTLNGSDLEVLLSGSSDFQGSVSVTNLKLGASGSSDIVIAGKTTNLRVDLSGSSDMKGFDLSADYCDVSASGASDVNITVNKELKVKASGASDVYYKGAGLIREISTSGASDVKKRN